MRLTALAWNVLKQPSAQKLTVEAADWKTEIHARQRQKIEAGETNPTLSTLVSVAFALGIALADLFTPSR